MAKIIGLSIAGLVIGLIVMGVAVWTLMPDRFSPFASRTTLTVY